MAFPWGVHPKPRFVSSLSLVLSLVLSPLVAGCPQAPEPAPRSEVSFTVGDLDAVPAAPFLQLPWPSDALRTDDGLQLQAFPNPYQSAALEDVLALFAKDHAYSAVQTQFFHVKDGVDDATLTTDALWLLDLDSGARVPIVHHTLTAATGYLPAGTVAVMPELGAVPSPRTALIVTSKAKSKTGLPLSSSKHLRALMTCDHSALPKEAPDCAAYEAIAQRLSADWQLGIDDIALINPITGDDPTSGVRLARAALLLSPPPVAHSITARDDVFDLYRVYEGVVPLVQFQAGTPPFLTLDGTSGGFVFGDDGVPVVQATEDVAFVVTVPKTPMPSGGYPIFINAHGTGGDLDTGLGQAPGDTALVLARLGIAMVSVSEPLHRTRRGYRSGQEETLTFNLFNPPAGRDNWRQSALEKVQLVSMLPTLSFDDEAGHTITFATEHLGYFGHSQGGIVGAIVAGVEDRIAGYFLSGAGAGFGPSLAYKTAPVDIPQILRTALLMPASEPVDAFHPVISLLSNFARAADPLFYGATYQALTPRPHLVATSGLEDAYTPVVCHAGLAGAYALPVAEPVQQALPVLVALGLPPSTPVVHNNVTDHQGEAVTAALLQYPNDGHFAVFDHPNAIAAFAAFAQTLVDTGTPDVPYAP